jgi:hypothetical protein
MANVPPPASGLRLHGDASLRAVGPPQLCVEAPDTFSFLQDTVNIPSA